MKTSDEQNTNNSDDGKAEDIGHFEADVVRLLLKSGVEYSGSADELRKTFELSTLENATDEDLRRAAQIVSRIAATMLFDRREEWEAISAAWERLHDREGVQAKRRSVVQAVEYYAEHRARHGVGPPLDPFIRGLQVDDERFAALDPRKAQTHLDRAGTEDEVTRGGATHVGAPLTAARLSCMVKAFGDTDEGKAKAAFLVARKPSALR
jgi:hypothetical protein